LNTQQNSAINVKTDWLFLLTQKEPEQSGAAKKNKKKLTYVFTCILSVKNDKQTSGARGRVPPEE